MSGGYELHQKLRTKTVRQLKKKDYDGAIASLYDGSQQLLRQKEQGSGCDLACYMIDVYQQAETKSTEESRKRIVTLVELASPDFWRKKVIDAAVKWSAGATKTPAGDGHLRLAIAEILSKQGGFLDAELHYIIACSPPPGFAAAGELFPAHAPKVFAIANLDWLEAYAQAAAKEHPQVDIKALQRLLAGSFALRGLLPLLLARALTSSRAYLSIFTSRLVQKHPEILLPSKPNPRAYAPPAGLPSPPGDAQQLYLTSSAELTFAQMTLAMAATAVEHKKKTSGGRTPDTLRQAWMHAVEQFEREVEGQDDESNDEDFYEQVLPELSKIYFDIQPPRNANPNFMSEMLGSLMGGGSGSGADANKSATIVVRRAPPPTLTRTAIEKAGGSGGGAVVTGVAADADGDLDLD